MTSPSYEYTPYDWVNNVTSASAEQFDRLEEAIRVATLLKSQSTLTVQKNSNGTWPARPTARADVTVQWKGPDPSPAIVSSGTGGMLNGVDVRLVTP